MSTADTAPTDLRFSSGVVEPESQPSSNSSSRPGSSHGGAEGSFVAAPPSGRPTRAGVRRNKTPDGRENPANPRRKDEKAVRPCFLKCLSNYHYNALFFVKYKQHASSCRWEITFPRTMRMRAPIPPIPSQTSGQLTGTTNRGVIYDP